MLSTASEIHLASPWRIRARQTLLSRAYRVCLLLLVVAQVLIREAGTFYNSKTGVIIRNVCAAPVILTTGY